MKNNNLYLNNGKEVHTIRTLQQYIQETEERIIENNIKDPNEKAEMYNDIYNVINSVLGVAVDDDDIEDVKNYDLLEKTVSKDKEGKTVEKYFLPRDQFDSLCKSGKIVSFVNNFKKTSHYDPSLIHEAANDYRALEERKEKLVAKTHKQNTTRVNIKRTKNADKIKRTEEIISNLEKGIKDGYAGKVKFSDILENVRKLVEESKDLAAERDPNKFKLRNYNRKHANDFAKAHPDMKISRISEEAESPCNPIIDMRENLGYDDLRLAFIQNYAIANEAIDYKDSPKTHNNALGLLYGKVLRAHRSRTFWDKVIHPFKFRDEKRMLQSLVGEIIEKDGVNEIFDNLTNGINIPENAEENNKLKEDLRNLYEKENEAALKNDEVEEVIVDEAVDNKNEIENDDDEIRRANVIMEDEPVK